MRTGALSRIGQKLGYTPQYVSMVASGKRNNPVIADAIAQERKHSPRQGTQLALPLKQETAE